MFRTVTVLAALAAVASGLGAGVLRADPPAREPARIEVAVAEETIAPGGAADVTVRVIPDDGVKINRYPKIKVRIPAVQGLVDEAVAEHGNPKPPPPDDMTSNYFAEPEPVMLELPVSPSAEPGDHRVTGEVRYFYCVAASGYCAPARARVSVPLRIR